MTSARIVGLASALVLMGFTVAIGAIPDSDDGEVHVCFNEKRPAKGAVRAFNPERACAAAPVSASLSWTSAAGPVRTVRQGQTPGAGPTARAAPVALTVRRDSTDRRDPPGPRMEPHLLRQREPGCAAERGAAGQQIRSERHLPRVRGRRHRQRRHRDR